MTALAIDAFIDGLDSDDALAVISAIRDRFGFTGTLFTPEDISSMAIAALHEHPEAFAAALTPALTQHVREGYEYRKLGDILAERGNETLGDAVTQAVGLLEAPGHYSYVPVLYVAEDGQQKPTIECTGFDTALAAYAWATTTVGTTLSDVEAAQGSPLGLVVSQVALSVRSASGYEAAHLMIDVEG